MLAHDIQQMITTGTLGPGAKLPSVREMSRKRSVSVTTVLEAYRRLEDAGLIHARPQSGYYVQRPAVPCEPPAVSKPPNTAMEVGRTALIQALLAEAHDVRVPLGAAVVDGEFLPQTNLSRMMARIVRADFEAQEYVFPPGHAGLRRQIARRLSEAGAPTRAEEVVTTTGCTEACNLCLHALLKPGDTVAIESPAYYGCLEWIELHGLRARQMPTDPVTGINVEALERVMKEGSVQAVLVTPSFQNPTGARMPDPAKEALAKMAARYEIPVIEDDV
jgi:DNA-binding transcriptional MocR family regulator